jgi:hypothetical protein
MLSVLTARLMHLGKLERDTPKGHFFEALTSHHNVSNCLMLRLAGDLNNAQNRSLTNPLDT